MRRFVLLAAYTAIMLLRAAPAHAADAAAVARIHSSIVDCGDGKTMLPPEFQIHTRR